MSLGTCTQTTGKSICQGPLCVSGQQITCERCGFVYDDHPMALAWKEEAKKPPPPPVSVPAQEYVTTIFDRVKTLESQLKTALNRVANLEKELQSLRGRGRQSA